MTMPNKQKRCQRRQEHPETYSTLPTAKCLFKPPAQCARNNLDPDILEGHQSYKMRLRSRASFVAELDTV